MPDLTQQIRERLDAPGVVVEVPDTEPWTVEQIEAFRRELREQFGTGVRIVPLDPPSDTATPGQMRAALLAVLVEHELCGNGYGPCDKTGICVPCRTQRAIAKALGIEVDRA